MVTPTKGEFDALPLNAEGRKVGESWDPAKDEAAGCQCRGYGAGGIMRLPGRLRISWQDDQTIKMEIEAGSQTRLFRFAPPATQGEPTWQGQSAAQWQYTVNPPRTGELKVVTNRMRA